MYVVNYTILPWIIWVRWFLEQFEASNLSKFGRSPELCGWIHVHRFHGTGICTYMKTTKKSTKQQVNIPYIHGSYGISNFSKKFIGLPNKNARWTRKKHETHQILIRIIEWPSKLVFVRYADVQMWNPTRYIDEVISSRNGVTTLLTTGKGPLCMPSGCFFTPLTSKPTPSRSMSDEWHRESS